MHFIVVLFPRARGEESGAVVEPAGRLLAGDRWCGLRRRRGWRGRIDVIGRAGSRTRGGGGDRTGGLAGSGVTVSYPLLWDRCLGDKRRRDTLGGAPWLEYRERWRSGTRCRLSIRQRLSCWSSWADSKGRGFRMGCSLLFHALGRTLRDGRKDGRDEVWSRRRKT